MLAFGEEPRHLVAAPGAAKHARPKARPTVTTGNSFAAGLLGLGWGSLVGAAVASGSPQRRLASSVLLTEKLKHAGIRLVAAELGRMPSGPAWVLTIETPDQQVMTLNVLLQAEQDPHSADTSEEIVSRVLRYLDSGQPRA